MFDPSQRSQRTKQIALLTIFTALYIVLRFIPYTILIGGAGGYLSFSDFLAPIIGILLGPYIGGLSIIIGNFGALGLGRSPVFPTTPFLDFLPDLVIAVSMGLLMRRKWLPVVLLNAGLLAVFFIEPLTSLFVTIPGTSISIPFAWMHIAAFIVLLTPLSLKAAKWVETANRNGSAIKTGEKRLQRFKNWLYKERSLAAGLAILTFIGTMMQHLMGNILFELSYGIISPPIIPTEAWPGVWTGVVLAYPVERTILIASAVLVGTPLIYTVVKNRMLKIGKEEHSKGKNQRPK